jgi:hypothetical protein
MPYARLFAPVVPAAALAAVHAAPHAHRAALALRGAAVLAVGSYLWLVAAPPARHVLSDRRALVDVARPLLAGAHGVATVDVGWVSAATDASGARLVDLAGLTDPAFAVLPGGHTSKRVDAAMLLDRDVDMVVLYAARDGSPVHAVGARLRSDPLFSAHYRERAWLPLGKAELGYVILERSPSLP